MTLRRAAYVMCWSMVMCLVLGLLGHGLAQDPQNQAEALKDPVGKDARPPEKSKLLLAGYLVPAQHVRISPLVAGQVAQVLVEEGSQVQRGQALLRLDRTVYELEVKRSMAEVERERALLEQEMSRARLREELIQQAQADVEQAAAHHALHNAELARIRALSKAKAASVEQVIEKEAQLRATEANMHKAKSALRMAQQKSQNEAIAAARAALAIAEAKLELAKYRLACTQVLAPISGTILVSHVQVGEGVNPDALVKGRTATLFEIADLSQLEAHVDVPESELAKVSQGQPCEVRLGSHPGRAFQGVVHRLSPTVAPDKATARAHVRIDASPEPRIARPGMRVIVRFLTK